MAAIIPSALSLAQGLGQNTGCQNVTDTSSNQTNSYPIEIVPNFSVLVYFILMAVLLCFSIGSFSLLNFSKTAINERKLDAISSSNRNQIQPLKNISKIPNDSESNLSSEPKEDALLKGENERIILLILIACISFIYFGILPSLQSVNLMLFFIIVILKHLYNKIIFSTLLYLTETMPTTMQ